MGGVDSDHESEGECEALTFLIADPGRGGNPTYVATQARATGHVARAGFGLLPCRPGTDSPGSGGGSGGDKGPGEVGPLGQGHRSRGAEEDFAAAAPRLDPSA